MSDMNHLSLLLLGSTTAKVWYLLPLVVVISVVYGATRHETPKEILLHSYRSAVWMVVFLSVIALIVWLGGFGVESEELSGKTIGLTLAALGWIFGAFWIGGQAFNSSSREGTLCVVTAGLYSLYYGFCNRDQFIFPLLVMVAAAGWAAYALLIL